MGDNLVPKGLSRLQDSLLQVEISKIIVHEAVSPQCPRRLLDSELLTGQHDGDLIFITTVCPELIYIPSTIEASSSPPYSAGATKAPAGCARSLAWCNRDRGAPRATSRWTFAGPSLPPRSTIVLPSPIRPSSAPCCGRSKAIAVGRPPVWCSSSRRSCSFGPANCAWRAGRRSISRRRSGSCRPRP